ncbi:hypothetical protein NC651_027776 [Populus alba x Populus x berolinensis]|nr:hypothetical protein NC651_027776 [Populus alba x Populus x berolinensis]
MFLLCQSFVLISLTLFQASSPASLPSSAIDLLKFQDSLPLLSQKLCHGTNQAHLPLLCQWPGVSCYPNKSFQVKALNLSGYGLSGVLNNSITYLCRHKHLVLLDLSGNHFTGVIPHLLANCGQLNTILLNDNRAWKVQLPADVFKAKKLVHNCQNLTILMYPPLKYNCEGVIAQRFSRDLLQLEVLYLDGTKLERGNSRNFVGLENLQESCFFQGTKLNRHNI